MVGNKKNVVVEIKVPVEELESQEGHFQNSRIKR